MNKNKHYLISDASRQVQVETHVLRYWEDELGLPIPRNELGHRYYTEFHIRLFRQIKRLKEQGYQLKAIRGILGKVEENQKAEPEALLEAQAQAVFRETGTGDRSMSRQENMEMEKNTGAESKIEPMRRRTPAEREAVAAPSGDQDDGENGKTEKETEADLERGPEAESAMHEGRILHSPGQAVAAPSARNEKKELSQAEISQLLAGEKMRQFQQIMNHVIGRAIEENSEKLSRDVSYLVHDKLMKEMEYLMRVSDEREEERFKRLDEVIRAYQRENQGRAEAAAAVPGRFPFFRSRVKKKKFGRNGNKL